MSGFLKRFEWFYRFLASKKLALILFALLGILLIPRTFIETTDISLGPLGSVIFAFLGLNLVLCTVQRIKTLSKSVLVIHIGILVTFSGVVISSFGYVSTVNIYEGTGVDTVYRWDLEKDVPLGVNLMVKKINVNYYPIPVRVGVLRGEEKAGLFELKTGETFQIESYTIRPETMEFPAKNLKLTVFNDDHAVGTANTEGESNLPEGFPYEFKLVAFQNPHLKRLWVDLELSRGQEVVAEGTSEVNGPLTWEKLSFYNTKVDVDDYGNPYAGIQITYDPGLLYVYSGFIILGIGSIMYMFRRLYGHR